MKGFNIGLEPWKILLCHRVDNLTQCFRGHCHPLARWLMSANKMTIQSSSLWQGIWITWWKVYDGLTQKELKSRKEMFCHLFGNSRICNYDGIPWAHGTWI